VIFSTIFLLRITSGFREVIFEENYLDGACRAESLNPCYTFFLQEKKPKAQLNFHFNKFLRRRLYVRSTRESPDFLFLLLKKKRGGFILVLFLKEYNSTLN